MSGDLIGRKTLLNGSDTARDAIELYLKGREVFSAMQEEDTMYESPITILYDRVAKAANERLEDHIMKEIHSVGVVVDKDELIRAMNYDRGQYQKGYQDGKDAAIAEYKSRYIELPCKIGDTVWAIRYFHSRLTPQKGIVSEMYFTRDMKLHITVKYVGRGIWGEKIFATREEAEAAIKEKEKNHEDNRRR